MKIAVYRCSYAEPGTACGLYDASELFDIDKGQPRSIFGYDANREECNHTWPLDYAETVVELWNQENKALIELQQRLAALEASMVQS